MDVREKMTIKYTCGAGTPEEAETNCTYFIRGECTASFCEYRRKKQTNADRIRAMSDEELAKAIASKAYTGACNDFDISYEGNCCHNCEKCDAIIKWLQQPAE